MNTRYEIGERIREIRTKKELTQEYVAEKCGLKRNNIARIEKGQYSTGIDIIGKIAEALNCKIDLIEKS